MKPTVEFLERWLNESPDTAVRILPDVLRKRIDETRREIYDLYFLSWKIEAIAAEKQKEPHGRVDQSKMKCEEQQARVNSLFSSPPFLDRQQMFESIERLEQIIADASVRPQYACVWGQDTPSVTTSAQEREVIKG